MTNAMNGGAGKDGNTYPVSNGGSFDINQGDLVYFDSSAHFLKPLDSDAHAATFVGQAYDSSFLNLYGQKKYDDGITVQQRGVGRAFQTVGDTYHDGDALYLGADAQTVTNTAGGSTHVIGYVYLPMGNTVTGAAGTLIEFQIVSQWPTVGSGN